MSDGSKIEWTDATWNVVTGCSVVSPGCTNCYAMRLAGTRLQHHPSRAGLTRETKAGPVWTGEVRLNAEWLDQPLRWRKPRRIFVCAHGDLFHENVPDEWIDRVFAVMALAPRHTFQVLTKRPERMRAYLSAAHVALRWFHVVDCFFGTPDEWPHDGLARDLPYLPNVWLGTSVEDQARADERIPHLLATPAAVWFLSLEPLLEPVDLTDLRPVDCPQNGDVNALTGRVIWPGAHGFDDSINATKEYTGKLGWVIVGGESGPGARPMHPEWARLLKYQCAAAGVPFFMKQMAHKAPIPADLLVRQWPATAEGGER